MRIQKPIRLFGSCDEFQAFLLLTHSQLLNISANANWFAKPQFRSNVEVHSRYYEHSGQSTSKSVPRSCNSLLKLLCKSLNLKQGNGEASQRRLGSSAVRLLGSSAFGWLTLLFGIEFSAFLSRNVHSRRLFEKREYYHVCQLDLVVDQLFLALSVQPAFWPSPVDPFR